VTSIALEITDPARVAQVAHDCADVTVLVNNAGAMKASPFIGASKAAELSLTNGIRMELSQQGTLVVAVRASFIDTDMAAGIDAAKISPESVARQAFDAVEAGQIEVLADERSRFVKAALPRDHELIYAPLLKQFFA
jgi:short-subunit dehydrogenase